MKTILTIFFLAIVSISKAQVNYPKFKETYSLCGYPNEIQAAQFAHAYDSASQLEIIEDTFNSFNTDAGFAHYKAYLVLEDTSYLNSAIPYFEKAWYLDGKTRGLHGLGGMYGCKEIADSSLKYTEMYIQELRKLGLDSIIDYQQMYYRYKYHLVGKIKPSPHHINVLLTSYDKVYISEIEAHQQKLNTEFKDKEHSPLNPKDLKKFKALDFFPIDSNYRVVAQFVRTLNTKPFKMKTSTDRLPTYQAYGILSFELKGKSYQLNVYQSLRLRETEKHKNYLFLPFTDLTNGVETYGGGRYIDLSIPEGNTVIIDFNKAYNPYCAYSYRYSCPIPPAENHLEIMIKAGIKKFH